MLNKAIKHNKEYRKEFRNSKQFDYSCRNHGSCSWCETNRRHFHIKRELASKQDLNEYKKYDN